MPYLTLSDADLWYEDSGGDGPPVVLLHPFTGNTDVWEYQVGVFTKPGFRCVSYDRRGWGRTRDRASESQSAYATDDLDALVTGLGLGRVHLVATGGGGYIALDHAISHPEQLRSLVVSCSGGPLHADPEYMAIGRKYGRTSEFLKLPSWLKELSPAYRAANPDGVDRWVEIEEHSRNKEGYQEPIRNEFTLKLLETIASPTLMIAGGADMYAPSPRMRIMAEHIPGCRLEVLPEAGHAAHWEFPDQWNELVLDFINGH